MGGPASSGSFEKGGKRAKEAGQKGGIVGGRHSLGEEEEEEDHSD